MADMLCEQVQVEKTLKAQIKKAGCRILIVCLLSF